MGEFDLLAKLRERLPAAGPRVRIGSGDDAAVWAPDAIGRLAVVHKSERGALADGFGQTTFRPAVLTQRSRETL